MGQSGLNNKPVPWRPQTILTLALTNNGISSRSVEGLKRGDIWHFLELGSGGSGRFRVICESDLIHAVALVSGSPRTSNSIRFNE